MSNISIPEDFWAEWYEADEPEQLEIIGSLIKEAKLIEAAVISPYSLTALMNSYLVDLAEHLERRFSAREDQD